MRDLRRHIERAYRELSGSETNDVPASDRVVRVDHNSADAISGTQELQKLEQAIEGLNDFDSDEDKQQALAEVGAMRRLWQSAKIRIEALFALIYRGLKYLAVKFFEKIVATICNAAIAAIGKATGLW